MEKRTSWDLLGIKKKWMRCDTKLRAEWIMRCIVTFLMVACVRTGLVRYSRKILTIVSYSVVAMTQVSDQEHVSLIKIKIPRTFMHKTKEDKSVKVC